ncbi:MAG: hypothetical protein GKR88_10305 [Flavobacteriaceae bacterium]|nr:MAG: hypothetical protein GKR88_10305 [Flavobacteriaceae bacterium]
MIKTRLNQLRMVSGNFEKGLRINKNPNTGAYVPSLIPGDNNGTNHINIVVHPYTAAIAHTHSNDVAYKMFSAPDILKMAQIVNRVQSNANSTVLPLEITHILVVDNNDTDKTYAIRFDDMQSIQILQDIISNKKKQQRFNKKLKNAYESDYSYQTYTDETDIFKQQRHLFKHLEKYNLNISLYEANFNDLGLVDHWQKINKETLEQEPCN